MLGDAETKSLKALIWAMKQEVGNASKEPTVTLIVRIDQYLLLLRGLELLLEEETI